VVDVGDNGDITQVHVSLFGYDESASFRTCRGAGQMGQLFDLRPLYRNQG
jgi:hypothetical protein